MKKNDKDIAVTITTDPTNMEEISKRLKSEEFLDYLNYLESLETVSDLVNKAGKNRPLPRLGQMTHQSCFRQ